MLKTRPSFSDSAFIKENVLLRSDFPNLITVYVNREQFILLNNYYSYQFKLVCHRYVQSMILYWYITYSICPLCVRIF